MTDSFQRSCMLYFSELVHERVLKILNRVVDALIPKL